MKVLTTAMELMLIQDDILRREKVYSTDFTIYMFEQIWGSTALGFPGVGGSAMTEATTYVLIPKKENTDCAHVYFGPQFAYKVNNLTDVFMKDLENHSMASVMEASSRYGSLKSEGTSDENSAE